MAVDHIAIYVKIGIDCAEGETKVPESEHISIANRIYAQLREQTTSDDYDGCIAGTLTNPDLMVEAVTTQRTQLGDLALSRLANELDRCILTNAQALMSRIPHTILTAYLNGELT